MVTACIKNTVYRLLLPACLITASVFRPSFLSLIYAFFGLIGPLLPSTRNNGSIPASVRAYLLSAFILSCAGMVAQIAFQTWAYMQNISEGDYVEKCENGGLEYWLIQAGFIRFPELSYSTGFDSTRLVLPEITGFVSSLIALILCCIGGGSTSVSSSHEELTSNEYVPESRAATGGDSPISTRSSEFIITFYDLIKRASDLIAVFAVLFAGIVNPSILNSVYFITGLVILTWWALYSPLRRSTFNTIKMLLIFYSGAHFLLLYSYQIPAFHDNPNFESHTFPARLVGLTKLVEWSCDPYYDLKFPESAFPSHWTYYANFVALVFLYNLMIAQYGFTRSGIRQHAGSDGADAAEEVKNLEGVELRSMRPDRPTINGTTTQGEASTAELWDGQIIKLQLLPRDLEESAGTSSATGYPIRRMTSQAIDRQKISFIFKGDGAKSNSLLNNAMQHICYFVFYNSYVFALLAMMAWAMLYHSVFGLLFLLTPCVLWALQDSRRWSFRMSPILVIYAEFLLLAQYVYSLDLTDTELPTTSWMRIVGFVRAEDREAAFIMLGAKLILSLPLFVLLRLHLREDYYDSLTSGDHLRRLNYGTFNSGAPTGSNEQLPIHRAIGPDQWPLQFFSRFLASGWLFIVAAVLLFNALTEIPVLYSVGYFTMWTLMLCSLVVSFSFFRQSILLTLTILIIYSSVVLIALYCYQFPGILEMWAEITHLTKEWNEDIGLVYFKDDNVDANLFTRLTRPILLVVVTVVQLKFFQRAWAQLVETPLLRSRSNSIEQKPVPHSLIERLKHAFSDLYKFLWRVSELHLHRLVLFLLLLVATTHYCALNVGTVLLIVSALCFPTWNRQISIMIILYESMVFTARRIYVMHFIPKKDWPWVKPASCGLNNATGAFPEDTHETMMEWIGFLPMKTLTTELVYMVICLSLIGIQYAVQYRQRHRRARHGESEPPEGILFADAVDAQLLDRDMTMACKVACNYVFYKFGLEISLIAAVFVASQRMDFLGVILMIWVLVFALQRRSVCRCLWPFFLVYLAIMLPLQYAVAVGWPPSECFPYPWNHWFVDSATDAAEKIAAIDRNQNLLSFLNLPDYRTPTSAHTWHLIVDFFLLMLVAAQEFVFQIESRTHPASSNNSIYANGDYTLRKENPHYDFISEQKSFVDYVKIAIFMYGHWITLVMVLAAGLGGTSLFALGYLVLAFWMLWQGNNLYTMRNYRRTLSRWYVLCAYNVLAMLWKVSLQVIGCVYVRQLDGIGSVGCILRQLFSVVCVDPASLHRLTKVNQEGCVVDAVETKIGLDLLAFAVIMFQLRALHSYFFQHCMMDVRCEIIQASRGAILINQLVEKQMKEQHIQQQQEFQQIRDRMDGIRHRYELQSQRADFRSPTIDTYAEDTEPLFVHHDDPCPYYDPTIGGEELSEYPKIRHRTKAKRGGDYYMFEEDPQDELNPIPADEETGKMDPAQNDLDFDKTLTAVEKAEQAKDPRKRMVEAMHESEKPEARKRRLSNRSSRARSGASPIGTDSHENVQEKVPEEEDRRSDEYAAIEAKDTMLDRGYGAVRFLWKIIASILHYMSSFFNRHSLEHRYVSYILDKEKIRMRHVLGETLYDVTKSTNSLRNEWTSYGMQMVSSSADIGRVEEEAEARWEQRNVLTMFTLSSVSFLAAYTHVLCYVCACLAHGFCAGLITLPLPLMVFFWGSLSNPRPPKAFWVAMITYTEFAIGFKFVFQFSFFAGSQNMLRYFGLQTKNYFAALDVVLLMALFLHRHMLRRIGLWKDANIADTFEPITPSHSKRPSTDVSTNGPEGAVQLSDPNLEPGAGPSNQLNETEMRRTGISHFYYSLRYPKFHYIRDLYPLMFFLDVLCLLIVVTQYSSFGELSNENVFASSRLPFTFVVMLFIMIVMIVIDRALYLRKASFGKLIYQLIVVIVLHVWIFAVLPTVTKKNADSNHAAFALYLAKCFNLLASAWQIRNDYPKLCVGHLLTHSYGLVNYSVFMVYMLLPLVFELRTIVDWTWTETAMPIMDFIKMEIFYSKLYLVKCARVMEENFPAPRGEPKSKLVKSLIGIPFILFLVFLVLSPLLIYSLLNHIGQRDLPQRIDLSIEFEGYPAIYKMSSQGNDLITANASYVRSLQNCVALSDGAPDKQRAAQSFIDDYAANAQPDIMFVLFRPQSNEKWPIASDAFSALVKQLTSGIVRLKAHLEVVRSRLGPKEPVKHSAEWTVELNKTLGSEGFGRFLDILREGGSFTDGMNQTFAIERLLPYFLVIPNEGSARAADGLLNAFLYYNSANQTGETDPELTYSTVSLQYEQSIETWNSTFKRSNVFNQCGPIAPTEKNRYLQMVLFIDRVFPSYLTSIAQGGMLAMYLAVVVFAARILRGVIDSGPLDVIISEMPNPDHVLKICLDIYLVRDARDFELEEDLFAKLIFLFRSPETLIKWTRPKLKKD